ncbi:DNA methyltransferase [Sphingomonas sp.]|uniref:DNA methyltransferase n=1 Tax=Sphingomonas sp. TaxID=28214 RepID=UPI0035BC3B78
MTLEQLLKKWVGKTGAGERAEYQLFLTEFAQALGVPVPGDAGFATEDYRFEAPVRSEAVFGTRSTKRIDLYKRNCFVLEAKQSQPGAAAAPPEPAAPPPVPILDLFGNPVGFAEPSKATPRYDRLMADARLQAERYALALPDHHRAPPFLLVADIGRTFELYFDWGGNGRGYGPFPDERQYRIALADLASDKALAGLGKSAAQVLRAIWTDPASVDPRLRAAEVTRDIAERLSRVAAQLEQDQRRLRPGDAEVALGIEATSLFLMRTLFCMFAEDTGLLPADSFKTFLGDAEGRSDQFWRRGLEDLWSRMNDPQEVNRYWSQGDAVVRYFNGNLFAGARVYDLDASSKRELLVAAGKDWRSVEPAIFGTLLEQVLTAADRAKLGAHYTPRAYVERLVQATMTDVLAAEWESVRAEAMALLDPPWNGEGDQPQAGGGAAPSHAVRGTAPPPSLRDGPPPRAGEEQAQAIALATAFHDRLVHIRVLDPACGTGNFLYVAMEQLLRLEGEVRQFVTGLGGTLAPAVHPNQFLGLELNPRAAVIAELVLWIGWLRYRLANTPDAIGEPVLPPLSNINEGTHGGYDAVLVRTATGEPDTANPRRPEWPEADFIVGNPPFIGGKDVRDRLGGAYAEALWRANPRVPKSADFVMHWWDRAADILTRPGTRLKRFGFVTTNSITQVFSRRVIEAWLAPSPLVGEGRGPLAPASGKGEGNVTSDPPETPPHPSATASLQLGVNPAPQGSDHAGGMIDPELSPTRGEGEVGKLHLVLAIPDHPLDPRRQGRRRGPHRDDRGPEERCFGGRGGPRGDDHRRAHASHRRARTGRERAARRDQRRSQRRHRRDAGRAVEGERRTMLPRRQAARRRLHRHA